MTTTLEPTAEPAVSEPVTIDRPQWGTVCGVSSAIFYTLAHISLRRVVHVDPILVSAVKSVPSVIVGGLVAVWFISRSRRLLSQPRDLVPIAAAACFAHLAGNGLFQWALGVLGMAIGVPVTLGSLLVGSAINGRLFLAETVSRKMAISTTIVILSIVILSRGSDSAAASMNHAEPSSLAVQLLALGAFCVAGFAYSTLGAAVRFTGSRGMSVPLTMLVSGLVGVILMGSISWWQHPLHYFTQQVSAYDWAHMSWAALSNVCAFLSIILALHFTRLLHVNLLNAAQAAFAAIAGVCLFQEPLSGSLIAGVLLMAAGFAYASRPSA
ncbi:MAG: hypothetical protein AAGF97_04295 [Planctomycetota bacterium]